MEASVISGRFGRDQDFRWRSTFSNLFSQVSLTNRPNLDLAIQKHKQTAASCPVVRAIGYELKTL